MLATYFIDISCHAEQCTSSYPYGTARRASEVYFGATWTECYAAARSQGWLIDETRPNLHHCLCPQCATELRFGRVLH